MTTADQPRIGIVGPCGAGKTTLAAALRQRGYQARAIAQEHSFAPQMWQRLTNPDVLIFLDASPTVCAARRRFQWTVKDWEEQHARLAHARAHADLYLHTDDLNPQEVLARVLAYLEGRRP